MKYKILFVIFLGFITGCATTGSNITKTQLQIREFQTKTYEINDTKMFMKAVLNVLQDDGFIVKNAVLELGLLSAEKSIDIENKGEAFWNTFWLGVQATWKKASVIECTGNITEFGLQTKVRINFQCKVLDNKGGIKEVRQIDDEKFYQEFFAKVDKGVFIENEKI